jgi:hypothetical protein
MISCLVTPDALEQGVERVIEAETEASALTQFSE